MCVQKLYGSEISRFLPFMLEFLDNLRRLFIFSNYIGEIDHFTLDGPSEKIRYLTLDLQKSFLLWNIRKKTTMSESLNVSIHMSGPQLNTIASILELLEIFSEVIVGSKCGPLIRIEKQAIS